MTNIAKWNTPSITTVLNTELNALANNTMSAASAAIANNTSLNMYVDIEVLLDPLSPAAGAYVGIYILEAVDGTNYPTPSDADLRLSTTQQLVMIPIGVAASTAQRVVASVIPIPPGTFKIKLDNQTGVAIPSNNNSTVKFLSYNVNLNG
jgi:hypothetical protein